MDRAEIAIPIEMTTKKPSSQANGWRNCVVRNLEVNPNKLRIKVVSQLMPQLAHVASCGWWRDDGDTPPTTTTRHLGELWHKLCHQQCS